MGYTTEYKGTLSFPDGFTIAMLKKIRKVIDPHEIGFKLTEDLDAIEWDGRDKYGRETVDHVNWITNEMREDYPDFKFTGHLEAQGEEIGDHWILHIDEDGTASRKSPGTVPELTDCQECNDIGWDLFRRDGDEYEIQRCDSCQKCATDEDAEAFVPKGVKNLIKALNNGEL